MKIRPLSGLSNPSASLRMVDLPELDGPMMIRISPCGTVKLTRSSTTRSSKEMVTSRNSRAGAGSDRAGRLPFGRALNFILAPWGNGQHPCPPDQYLYLLRPRSGIRCPVLARAAPCDGAVAKLD